MQCPACKEQIDDDSRFCDQCGGQIFICSVCGRPGKGKRCIFDGKEMIPAGGTAPQSTPAPQTSTVTIPAGAPPQTPAQTSPLQQTAPQYTPPPSAAGKVKLESKSLGIVIEAADGDVLGRKTGPFANVLGRFPHISGTHCKIVKANGNWHIQDLGSTNGTFCNNSKIAPNTPVLLSSGATVKIADIELVAAFDSGGGGTTRI